MLIYQTPRGTIELRPEGLGRYDAFLSTEAGRSRIGVVLGGNRSWQAQLVGRPAPLQARSRKALARGMAAHLAGAEAPRQPGPDSRRLRLSGPRRPG